MGRLLVRVGYGHLGCYCEASLTFSLPRPLAGGGIQVSIQPDGNVESLDCQADGSALVCLPLSSLLVPNFDARGALESVTLAPADAGTYTVALRVDGTPMGGGTYVYQSSSVTDHGACGEEETTTCLMPQTFTIAP